MKETTDDVKGQWIDTRERFIDKITVVKTKERVRFSAEPFSKGYKVHVQIGFDPDDSIQIDQLLKYESSDIHDALDAFIHEVIEIQLGGKLIRD